MPLPDSGAVERPPAALGLVWTGPARARFAALGEGKGDGSWPTRTPGMGVDPMPLHGVGLSGVSDARMRSGAGIRGMRCGSRKMRSSGCERGLSSRG